MDNKAFSKMLVNESISKELFKYLKSKNIAFSNNYLSSSIINSNNINDKKYYFEIGGKADAKLLNHSIKSKDTLLLKKIILKIDLEKKEGLTVNNETVELLSKLEPSNIIIKLIFITYAQKNVWLGYELQKYGMASKIVKENNQKKTEKLTNYRL